LKNSVQRFAFSDQFQPSNALWIFKVIRLLRWVVGSRGRIAAICQAQFAAYWLYKRAPEQLFADAVQLSMSCLNSAAQLSMVRSWVGRQAIRSKMYQVLKYTHRFQTFVFYAMLNEVWIDFLHPARSLKCAQDFKGLLRAGFARWFQCKRAELATTWLTSSNAWMFGR
jgi:hypothetical protein